MSNFIKVYAKVLKLVLNREGQYDHIKRIITGLEIKHITTDMSVMGLGKTYISIMTIPYMLVTHPKISNVLISSANNIHNTWISTIADILKTLLQANNRFLFIDDNDKEHSILDIFITINDGIKSLRGESISEINPLNMYANNEGRLIYFIHSSSASLSNIGLGYNATDNDKEMMKNKSTKFYNSKTSKKTIPIKSAKPLPEKYDISYLDNIDITRFKHDEKYVDNSNNYIFDKIIAKNSTYFIQDEIQYNISTTGSSFYVMATVSFLIMNDSYVLNLSGTPTPKVKNNPLFYAMNAIYFPSHMFISRAIIKVNGKLRTEDVFSKEGVNALCDFLDHYNNTDLPYYLGVGQLSNKRLKRMRKEMLEFVDENENNASIDNITRFCHNFLKPINALIGSAIKGDMSFAKKSVIHKYQVPMIYKSEYFESNISSRGSSTSLVSKESDRGSKAVSSTLARICESNIALFIVIKTLELLENPNNRIIIFLSAIKNIDFMKGLLVAFSPLYGIDFLDDDIQAFFSKSSKNTVTPLEIKTLINKIKQNKIRVLFVGYDFGSEGISLNEPINPETGVENHTTHVFLNATFKSSYQQAFSRAIRSGIVNDVHVHFMINSSVVLSNMMRSYYNVVDLSLESDMLPIKGLFSHKYRDKNKNIVEVDLSDLDVEDVLQYLGEDVEKYMNLAFPKYTLVQDEYGKLSVVIMHKSKNRKNNQYITNLEEYTTIASKYIYKKDYKISTDNINNIANKIIRTIDDYTFNHIDNLNINLSITLAYALDAENYDTEYHKIYITQWKTIPLLSLLKNVLHILESHFDYNKTRITELFKYFSDEISLSNILTDLLNTPANKQEGFIANITDDIVVNNNIDIDTILEFLQDVPKRTVRGLKEPK